MFLLPKLLVTIQCSLSVSHLIQQKWTCWSPDICNDIISCWRQDKEQRSQICKMSTEKGGIIHQEACSLASHIGNLKPMFQELALCYQHPLSQTLTGLHSPPHTHTYTNIYTSQKCPKALLSDRCTVKSQSQPDSTSGSRCTFIHFREAMDQVYSALSINPTGTELSLVQTL